MPARAFVNYCSWASHHLPDVFADPEAFRPERFAPEARAALPKGAYVPFGGGSRTCIGMRFGQLEVRTIAPMLSHCTLSLPARFELTIRQMPTISPKEGLPMLVQRACRALVRALCRGLRKLLQPPGFGLSRAAPLPWRPTAAAPASSGHSSAACR